MRPFKVVHISSYLTGGAGIAAYRLHRALLQNEVNSSILSLAKSPFEDSTVHQIEPDKASIFTRGLKKINKLVFGEIPIFINKRHNFYKKFKEIYPSLNCGFASLPLSEHDILNHPVVQQADVIHLHWIAGMVDYTSFFKKNNKPVVWTLHDMNPILGLYHYDEDENGNDTVSLQLDYKIKYLKKVAIQKRQSLLTYVTPSQWLYDEAIHSFVFDNVQGITIANAVDTEIFIPKESKLLRVEMGIPDGNTILMFVAETVNDYRKGFDLLLKAMESLSRYPLTLIVIGNSSELNIPTLDIRFMGSINEPEKLREYYSLADAFILPSRKDNLPNVMLESMACGIPVLSFDVGGMSTIIKNNFNGLKTKDISVDGLINILNEFINTKTNYSSNNIRKFAVENFSYKIVSEKYKKIYHKVLSDNHCIMGGK